MAETGETQSGLARAIGVDRSTVSQFLADEGGRMPGAHLVASAARHFPRETRVSRPNGGYFLWFEFPERVDSLQLFQLALAQGISLAPGPIFSANRQYRNCARLNYGTPWDERCEQAMATLGRLLAAF